MTLTDAYVIFGIPAIVVTGAYIAVLAHERSMRKADRRASDAAAHPAAPNVSQRNAP